MSNLGFHHAMRDAGIAVVTTAVGDRYVLEALRAERPHLGGEQSGHVVFTDAATTGDGLLTALHVMARMAATGRSLAELAGVVHRLPQMLINVPVADQARGRGLATRSPPRSPRPRPSSATTAGCCCARRAPSSWSGSWSRRPPRSRPTRSPAGSPTVVAAV